jgi:hypothetical protein
LAKLSLRKQAPPRLKEPVWEPEVAAILDMNRAGSLIHAEASRLYP